MRANFDVAQAVEQVKPIIERVKTEGEQALWDFARHFDKVEQNPQLGGRGIRVPQELLKQAWNELSHELQQALCEAKRRIHLTHTEQMPQEYVTQVAQGATIRQRWLPATRVGLYVPGGVAVYPSSVLMNVIPAQVAGVKSLVVASPPQIQNGDFNGMPHKTILAACYMLNVTEVVAVGGAGAVAMLTYGVEGVAPVDIITGPGNIYVAAAKQLVQGDVGIDAVAGPTEIAILADRTAVAEYVAADLIGQAEHDELAGSVLITDCIELAEKVQQLLPEFIAKTANSDRVIVALEGSQSGIVLVKDMADGVQVANAYGAEHLEIQVENAQEVANTITNAGAIFIGNYTPVPLGDYIGGSNHVLPTGGTSRFSSGLGVHSFLRSVQQIEYSATALDKVTDDLVQLANNELLPAHGEAALIRRKITTDADTR